MSFLVISQFVSQFVSSVGHYWKLSSKRTCLIVTCSEPYSVTSVRIVDLTMTHASTVVVIVLKCVLIMITTVYSKLGLESNETFVIVQVRSTRS